MKPMRRPYQAAGASCFLNHSQQGGFEEPWAAAGVINWTHQRTRSMREALLPSKPRRFSPAVPRPYRDQSLGGKTAIQLIQGGVCRPAKPSLRIHAVERAAPWIVLLSGLW
jgi:hypothetical protein